MSNTSFPNGESYRDVEKRIASFLEFLKQDYDGKHIAIVAHQAPQLALDVLLKGRAWQQAIDEVGARRRLGNQAGSMRHNFTTLLKTPNDAFQITSMEARYPHRRGCRYRSQTVAEKH